MKNPVTPVNGVVSVFWQEKHSRSKAFGVASFYSRGHARKALPDGIPFMATTFEYYSAREDFGQLRRIHASGDHEQIMKTVESAGLGGCGGAYFPVAQKWKAVLSNKGPRYLVVNAQEGEKYTFKDYCLMLTYPQLVVEGAALAALAIEAKEVFIVVNAAYEHCVVKLQQAVDALQLQMPFLRLKITVATGPDPDLYVCGEETALMQYMNHQRGEPQLRPPFPFQQGFRGKPTLVQNVETLCWIPALLEKPDLFARKGKLKLVHVWGDVNSPGIYEAAIGSRLDELLDLAEGMKKNVKLNAIEVGGMAGGLLPAHLLKTPYDHGAIRAAGAMLGTGSVRFLGKSHDLLALSKEATVFFRDQSCGRCSACRVGTQVLAQLLDTVADNGATDDLRQQIDDVTDTLVQASLCALGKGAPAHFASYLRYWGDNA